jgi:hypothetical protein
MLDKIEAFFTHLFYLFVRYYNQLWILFHQWRPVHHRREYFDEVAPGIVVHTFERQDGPILHVKKVVEYNGVGPHHSFETLAEEPVPAWWYIGATLEDGDTLDLTETLNPFLVAGNVIRPELLRVFAPTATSFQYLHPTTFEEHVVESEGIVVHAGAAAAAQASS